MYNQNVSYRYPILNFFCRPNSNAGRQLPQVPGSQDRIPSVPGYAKPYARPFDAPPSPPPSPPSSDKGSNKPLETDIDHHDVSRGGGGGNDTLNRSRSRSVGQILETNFDDPEPSPSINTNGHSRSMEGPHLAKLSLTPQLLETGL